MNSEIDAGTVTITSKNMVVIPKRAREKFKLHEGQKLKVMVGSEEITFTPVLTIEQLIGILKGPQSSKELIAESRKNISRFD
ncbi:AbrB/MazE/SpoVT family DNA-binding domain-containing protein [Candidatus Woesearchaeota archaeon]|nr:AbrB/MazE/SpoVT family DNA-binding domain-containing protein [Candidatus Woesearchaeota archaeon]